MSAPATDAPFAVVTNSLAAYFAALGLLSRPEAVRGVREPALSSTSLLGAGSQSSGRAWPRREGPACGSELRAHSSHASLGLHMVPASGLTPRHPGAGHPGGDAQ